MTLQQDAPPATGNLTQAVDILAFVEAQEIPPDYFETPYYLAPAPGGEKDYALLRETLRRTRKIGIAYVVIQARQHLAALIPHGQSLVLNTLRWNTEEYERRPVAQGLHAKALHAASATPLHQMRVTGCDDYEDEDALDLIEAGIFESDEVFDAMLRPRMHVPTPRATRSSAARAPRGAPRLRRLARRA